MQKETLFNTGLVLSDAKLSDVKQGFELDTAVGNILKWYIVGLYINNDKIELKEVDELFSKNGSLYSRRAYKSEAKAVHKNLVEGTIKVNDLSLAQLAKTPASDLPSLGVLYKGIPKDAPAPKDTTKKENLKAARKILTDNDGSFNGLVRPSDIVSTAKAGLPVFKAALEEAKLSISNQAIIEEFPAVTTENLNKITVAMKNYMDELHAQFPKEYEIVAMHMLNLDTAPMQETKTA